MKRPKPKPTFTTHRSDSLRSIARGLDAHQEWLELTQERNKRVETISRYLDAAEAARAQGKTHKKAALYLPILLSPAYDHWIEFKVKCRSASREAKRESAHILRGMVRNLALLLAYLIWIPFLFLLAAWLLT